MLNFVRPIPADIRDSITPLHGNSSRSVHVPGK